MLPGWRLLTDWGLECCAAGGGTADCTLPVHMYTVHCTLYNCTHPVIVFKIYWRLEDLRGEERTWEGRWKLKDIRFKINAMLEGLYKHIMMMLSETRWTQAWPGGRGTHWTLTCVTCHYHWFVICLYLTWSRHTAQNSSLCSFRNGWHNLCLYYNW